MRKLLVAILCMLAVSYGMSPVAEAGVISLGSDTLDTLVGANPVALGSLLTTDMSDGVVKVDVFSQAYTGDAGLYVYLYQVDNTGSSGDSAVELFTLWPFIDADDDTEMGSLSGSIPTGFFTGGQLPESLGYIDDGPTTGPVVSFYYTKRVASEIAPGEHSMVMYVVSDLSPGLIIGNIIGGAVGSGEVVGPVPEPSTLVYLIGAATLAILAVRRRRR